MKNMSFKNSYLGTEALSLVDQLSVSVFQKLIILVPIHIRNALFCFILYFSLSFAFTSALAHTDLALPLQSFGLVFYTLIGWVFLIYLLIKAYKNNFTYINHEQLSLDAEKAESETLKALLTDVSSNFQYISTLDLVYLLTNAAKNLKNKNADAELLVEKVRVVLSYCDDANESGANQAFDDFLKTPTFNLVDHKSINMGAEATRAAFRRFTKNLPNNNVAATLFLSSLTGISPDDQGCENIFKANHLLCDQVNISLQEYIKNIVN